MQQIVALCMTLVVINSITGTLLSLHTVTSFIQSAIPISMDYHLSTLVLTAKHALIILKICLAKLERVIKRTFTEYCVHQPATEQLCASFKSKLWRMEQRLSKVGSTKRKRAGKLVLIPSGS